MNIQEEIENKIKTAYRNGDIEDLDDRETSEEEAQRIKDEDIEPTEIPKNQILSDLEIMKKDVDAGYYNFLNAAEYLEKLNKILTKVNQLIGRYKYNPCVTDFSEPI